MLSIPFWLWKSGSCDALCPCVFIHRDWCVNCNCLNAFIALFMCIFHPSRRLPNRHSGFKMWAHQMGPRRPNGELLTNVWKNSYSSSVLYGGHTPKQNFTGCAFERITICALGISVWNDTFLKNCQISPLFCTQQALMVYRPRINFCLKTDADNINHIPENMCHTSALFFSPMTQWNLYPRLLTGV
jgi:hypothetical protein